MNPKFLPIILFLFLAVFSVKGFSQCPSGMVSYWKLQESGTTFDDISGNHDATAVSGSMQTDGISGYAQQFANSYLTVPAHADYNWASNSSYTIELWVKFTEVSGTQVIIGRDDPVSQVHWWIGKTAGGKIEWFTKASDGSNGDIESLSAINNGQWHHVVAMRDGATNKNYLYVDGILQNTGGTDVFLSGNLSSTDGLTIGNMVYNSSPTFFYNGGIDEVAIYNRVLTPTEITAHYTNAVNNQMGYCSGNAPELLSNPLTTATINQTYTYRVKASGNPAPKYYLDNGPANMTVNETTGVISWTPTTFSQNAPVSIRITNSNGTIYQNFQIFMASAPVCNENLIAYWNFDEMNAPYVDKIASYNLKNNSAASAPTKIGGRVGSALSFDGVNDSLNMDDTFAGNVFFDFDNAPSFSVELWMRSDATPASTMVLVGREEDENNSQYWIGVTTSGAVAIFFRDYLETPNSSYIEGGSVLDGAWHHIAVTYNATSNNLSLYVDNSLIETKNQNFGNFGGNDDLNIGCLKTTTDMFWYDGVLDELSFYNTALTEATITSHFNAGAAGKGSCSQNFAPLVVSTPVTAATEDAAYTYKFVANDAKENDITGISAPVLPSWLTLTYNAPDTFATISGTPVNANVGANEVTFRVTDGSINVDQTFTITVANVNDAPAFTTTPVATTNEDALYSYAVTASDVDAGDVLTYTAPVKPSWLTFDAGTHVLSGTPTNDNVGIADITITVNDGTTSVNQTYQLTVVNVNDAPVFSSVPVETVHANDAYYYEITATDVDANDVLTYSVTSKPTWLSFVGGATSGILSGTPTVADQGTHAIIVKVSDGTAETMQGFTLTVTAPNAVIDIDNSIINKVFPNPASDRLYFNFAKSGKVRIEIYDMAGNLQKEASYQSTDAAEIEVNNLSNGLYIYKAFQDDKVGVGKFIKQ